MRLEHPAIKKMRGQAQTVGHILCRDRLQSSAAQERRKDQQTAMIWAAHLARHSTATPRRDINQIVGFAAHGAGAQIQSKAQFIQQPKFPPHKKGPPFRQCAGRNRIQQGITRLVSRLVRFAFWKHPGGDRDCGIERDQRDALLEKLRRTRGCEFSRQHAQMFGDSSPPCHVQPVARLQHRANSRRGAAMHHTKMPAMFAREQFQYSCALTMRPQR